jgi:hypothetical protein
MIYFVLAFCVIAQLLLLYLVSRAYRATRHRSLLWLMSGNGLALVFYAAEVARYVFIASSVLRWQIYLLLCLPVMLVSVVVGVFGTALLLRAFSAAVLREKTG